MLPDLNRLKVFYHVYTANSIIKAAEALYITQPAVSQQIKSWRRRLRPPCLSGSIRRLFPPRRPTGSSTP